MREVFHHQDFITVGYYHSVLEGAEIDCVIRNPSDILTGLPDPKAEYSLCIENNEDYDEAVALIRDAHQPEGQNLPDWKCPACQESVPGNFDLCWKCGEPAAPKASA